MVQPVYNLTLQTQIQNVSGITAAEVASSGFATYNAIHASGYVRNADLVGSGYTKSVNGLKNAIVLVGSGGTTIWTDGQTIQISASGGGTGSGVSLQDVLDNLVASGFVGHAELLVSGFLRHQDLLTSGYVRTINGLSNTPTIVGSGSVGVWVDGNTIQVGNTAGGGDATYSSLHTSGYIRNVDFVSSGFQKASDITASGYVKHADMLVSGYARLTDLLGSGFKPESATDHGALLGLLDNDHPQYIRNSDFITSGFITKSEVASSGFATRIELVTSGYVRHSDMLVSGYARLEDLLGSGFKPENQIDHGTIAGLLDNDHPQYILNSAFITSGFLRSSDITSSGYLRATDRTYPVDARAVSGHILPSTAQSGYWDLGSIDANYKTIYAGSGVFTSGITAIVNGKQTFKYDLVDDGRIYLEGQNPHSQAITITARDASYGAPSITSNSELILKPASNIGIAGTGAMHPRTSGAYDLGLPSYYFNYLYANSGVFQNGVTVSGAPVVHTISDVPGSNIRLIAGANMTITPNIANRTIQFDATAGGPGGSPESDQYPVDARAVSGHIDMGTSGYFRIGTAAAPAHSVYANSGVFTSGVYVSGLPVPTQSQITTSGYVTQASMLTSGYLRHQDLLTSGYVRTVNSLSNAVTLVPGSGVHSLGTTGSDIYINVSGGPYTCYTRFDYPWNATSLQNASGLEYPIGPGEVICGEANLFFSVNTTATGMAFAINGPASPDTVQMAIVIPTTATASMWGSATAYETKVIGTAGLVTTSMAMMKFFVINGPNAGTLAIRICSEGTTQVTLRKGSWAKFTRV